MDRCDPRSRPLATNRAAHRAEKISAAYRNPRHRRQGIPGLRCRATPNTANLLSENRPRVTDAGVSLRRLTSRNSLTLKNFFQHGVEDGFTETARAGVSPIPQRYQTGRVSVGLQRDQSVLLRRLLLARHQ